VITDQWRSKGTLRPEAKNIFMPSPTKTAEFKAKNRRKSAKVAKVKHLLFVTSVFFFRSNEIV